MRNIVFIAALLASFLVSAVSAQEKLYKFTLTQQEAAIVLSALADKPWRDTNQIIMKIQQQFQEQNKPAEPAKK